MTQPIIIEIRTIETVMQELNDTDQAQEPEKYIRLFAELAAIRQESAGKQ